MKTVKLFKLEQHLQTDAGLKLHKVVASGITEKMCNDLIAKTPLVVASLVFVKTLM